MKFRKLKVGRYREHDGPLGWLTLREHVRNLLEVAATGEQAMKAGLALMRQSSGNRIAYVLYNPEKFLVALEAGKPGHDAVVGYVLAMPHSGDCHDALEVKKSAAEKGYGPLLYDIVMSDGDGGLMPDRVSVSKAASGVWQHYATKRSDVKQKPFDDGDQPKTPESDDDCPVHHDEPDFLNAAYDGPGQSGAKSKLMDQHTEVMSALERKGLKRQALEKTLAYAGELYFDARYK